MMMMKSRVGVLASHSLPRLVSQSVCSIRPPGAVLHSSNEPGEPLQWLCHSDSTTNIVMSITITIAINIIIKSRAESHRKFTFVEEVANVVVLRSGIYNLEK